MLTGLFFGSFNPVHIGHMAIANYMIEFTDLEELWFVVSPQNPLKDKEILIDDKIRFEMIQSAITGDLRFGLSNVESLLPRPSFTIDTLHYLQNKFPDREFVLIMGSDGLETFHLWKDYQKLILDYKRYIYPRSEYESMIIDTIENGMMVKAPLIEISSTFIRQAVAEGKDMRYFVPKPVWNMIVIKGLYK